MFLKTTVSLAVIGISTLLLSACSQGGYGGMALKPVHTDDSNGFALTLSKKAAQQTMQELQNEVQARQNYSSRLSDQ